MRALAWTASLALVLAVVPARADTAGAELSLGSVGTLQVPSTDGMRRIEPPADSAAVLAFESVPPRRALLLLTPIPLSDSFLSDAEITKIVDAGVERVRRDAVETEFPLIGLRGEHARGHYFVATDRAPKPGEYRYLYQGAVATGAALVTFTILFNDGAEREAKAALDTVRGLRLRSRGGV